MLYRAALVAQQVCHSADPLIPFNMFGMLWDAANRELRKDARSPRQSHANCRHLFVPEQCSSLRPVAHTAHTRFKLSYVNQNHARVVIEIVSVVLCTLYLQKYGILQDSQLRLWKHCFQIVCYQVIFLMLWTKMYRNPVRDIFEYSYELPQRNERYNSQVMTR